MGGDGGEWGCWLLLSQGRDHFTPKPFRDLDKLSPQRACLLASASRQLLVNVSCVGDGSQGLETG